jgi:glucuronate isomerase
MKPFLDENFILQTETAQKLYHNHAEKLPIIDYHCHLNPKFVAENRQFENLSQIWLEGDHYKWRALRANGIPEEYITGKASDFEKFQKWAETVPYTMRNPLYHWTHLELARPFGIKKILNGDTAKEIYEEASAMLRTPEFSVHGIMKKMNVEVVCTTDDPIDTLEYHKIHRDNKGATKMFPTWRPDKAMAVESPEAYNAYLAQLEKAADMAISSFDDLLAALKKRQDFFETMGCRLSDHGMETFFAEDYKDSEIKVIFLKIRSGRTLDQNEILKFKSAMLYHFAVMDADKNWTQQFHFGVIRNNNTKMFKQVGPDTGHDAIGDFEIARSMSKFFDRLFLEDKLTRTILYNLNPRDNELVITLALAYNDGSLPGKMQFGSGWWFLDQKDGMEKQMNALSTLGLLSRFIGMLTDSRSFLSYPRHDYFRRILCNLVGRDIENGEIPSQEMKFIEKMIENISYYNAKEYFKF